MKGFAPLPAVLVFAQGGRGGIPWLIRTKNIIRATYVCLRREDLLVLYTGCVTMQPIYTSGEHSSAAPLHICNLYTSRVFYVCLSQAGLAPCHCHVCIINIIIWMEHICNYPRQSMKRKLQFVTSPRRSETDCLQG